MRWQLQRHTDPQPVAQERVWLAQAAAACVDAAPQPALDGPAAGMAHLWNSPPCWVAPQRYRLAPGWGADPAEGDWPLQLRDSGGGLVPQGPGVLNLTLLWPRARHAPPDPQAIYRGLCALLAQALQHMGLPPLQTQAVDGSFCDGRFNLSLQGRKLVGTAQRWCQVDTPAGPRPMALAHALIFVALDFDGLCQRANALEAALGHPQRYQSGTMTDLCRHLPPGTHPMQAQQQLVQALDAVLADSSLFFDPYPNATKECFHGFA